jgi:hypothetical protein
VTLGASEGVGSTGGEVTLLLGESKVDVCSKMRVLALLCPLLTYADVC